MFLPSNVGARGARWKRTYKNQWPRRYPDTGVRVIDSGQEIAALAKVSMLRCDKTPQRFAKDSFRENAAAPSD
jgi:hypothetical protein